MQIVCSESALASQVWTLLFIERYTAKKKEYSLSAPFSPKNILQASLTEKDLEQLLKEGQDWDVYVMTPSQEKIRLASMTEPELLYFLKDGKMLIPFITIQGNISFKLQSPGLIVRTEQIQFIGKDHLFIKGCFLHPSWSKQPGRLKGMLVLSSSEDEYAYKAPLKIGNRFSSLNEHNHGVSINYEAVIPIKELFIRDYEAVRLKGRIEILYSEANGNSMSASSPIKVKFARFSKRTLIRKRNGQKKAITLAPAPKARQLIISIYPYNFKKNIKGKMNSGIVFLKRHPMIKQVYKHAFYWLGKLPSSKKVIVFESFLGKQFSDNPRAIYEYLKQHQYPYTFYWSADKKCLDQFKDKNVRYVRRFSLKWLFILPRARFWVTNSRMPVWLPKPKQTTYLQTWHGTPLKRLAADMDEVYIPGTTAENYKKNFIKEAQNWDYLISPNAYSTEIFRRAFQFDKDVLETGYPRNDFINYHAAGETKQKLADKYSIPSSKRVILYAPTWRDNQFYGKGKYRFDIQLDLDLMQKMLGEEFVILFRLHYLVSENLDLTAYKGFAYDVSRHEDIRELYVMADLLVTDYSSVFFDYGNLKRPMVFYVYDIEQYRDHLRGFYFDFEKEAPGPLVKTTEEMIQVIKDMQAEGFQPSAKLDSFFEKFCYLEHGDSTRKVVEKVFPKQKTNRFS
ncbi:CDP-glycerol glycerophosphotransferase family protein [Domibacillus robiginosus]|uniref:CDP-glycerol glycerophosphotransferase family protein n=1 Tax=Domibacillus robiginosus TaxID=1071054 RepID=UPI00155A32E2|nr:CDP-glycerol glycerophosphotransferase family protein [Domibacillus robiginosus]